MAEKIPYGTTEPIHRFDTNEAGRVVVENLPTRDLRSLIGPGGLSSQVPHIEDGKVSVRTVYAVEGMNSINISADVPEGSVVIGVSYEEAAGRVVEWIQKSLDETAEARRQREVSFHNI
jgi:hypothetical protein